MSDGTPGVPGHSADTPYDATPPKGAYDNIITRGARKLRDAAPPEPDRRDFRVLQGATGDAPNLVAWREMTDAEDGPGAVVIAWAGPAPLYEVRSAVRLEGTQRVVVIDYLNDWQS